MPELGPERASSELRPPPLVPQVIHHFPQADNYRFLAKVFAECCRVLRPGGAMVLNHSTEQQHRLGYWCAACAA